MQSDREFFNLFVETSETLFIEEDLNISEYNGGGKFKIKNIHELVQNLEYISKTNISDKLKKNYNCARERQKLRAKLDKALQTWENAEKKLEEANKKLETAGIAKTNAVKVTAQKLSEYNEAETLLKKSELKSAIKEYNSIKRVLEKAQKVQHKKQIAYAKAVTKQAAAQDKYDNAKNNYNILEELYNQLESL